MKKIKGKNYYREAITEVNRKNKNSCILKKLYNISDLFYRAYDEELYKTVTDSEWEVISCINNILSFEKPEDIRCAGLMLRGVERSRKSKTVSS